MKSNKKVNSSFFLVLNKGGYNYKRIQRHIQLIDLNDVKYMLNKNKRKNERRMNHMHHSEEIVDHNNYTH